MSNILHLSVLYRVSHILGWFVCCIQHLGYPYSVSFILLNVVRMVEVPHLVMITSLFVEFMHDGG